MIRVLHGDCRDVLPQLAAGSVHCVVTSPPYYGLRDYGTAQWDGGDPNCTHVFDRSLGGRASTLGGGKETQVQASVYRDCRCGARRIDRQIGLEATPDEYLQAMVAVFREVRRVLRDDGTCWVNMGDSYASGGGGGPQDLTERSAIHGNGQHHRRWELAQRAVTSGLAPKQLLMMPARLALALQADGWWIRSDIIWAKPNPMPESVTDRPTSAHEHVFLLSKSARYYYDADAVREEADQPDRVRADKFGGASWLERQQHSEGATFTGSTTRNLRNVWTIATSPFPEAHFATFPPALAETCIKAGCPPWGTVLDPFAGAGTTMLVADRLQRHAIGIELNAGYAAMSRARLTADAPLLVEVAD